MKRNRCCNFSWTILSKGKGANMRLTICEAPTHETKPVHDTAGRTGLQVSGKSKDQLMRKLRNKTSQSLN